MEVYVLVIIMQNSMFIRQKVLLMLMEVQSFMHGCVWNSNCNCFNGVPVLDYFVPLLFFVLPIPRVHLFVTFPRTYHFFCLLEKGNIFHTDKVFGPATTTRHVYDVAAQHVVGGAMEGINGNDSSIYVEFNLQPYNWN